VRVGDLNLNNLNSSVWRAHCGGVMQDGYLFSDTIARNISLGEDNIDRIRLLYAARVANIQHFIDTLPHGFNTKIGQEGMGLSQGQKQRLLIARAAYKNPAYLFFDEATNALDAHNERLILQNLQEALKGKTVVVVAHRLSTVRDADHIVVLERGEIVEQGTHAALTERRGAYYHLVKEQLELGA
ncbi:MAG TPA: ATP-binding cassette domain-containing protein, partial [Saprospiraceae bacterium]|nr:ATP-binding cassette domain-containing protein [Saprospiraceae bacterium]